MKYEKSELPVLLMHTHGVADRPPSPTDLFRLLLSTEDGGAQASIVITPSSRFLLIRTLQTPNRNASEVKETIATYEETYRGEMDAEVDKFVQHMKRFGGVTEEILKNYTDKLDPTMQMKLLHEFCSKNHIAMYTAIRGSNNYKRVKY